LFVDVTFWLHLLKFLHIGGLILWLGPSGGAWLLIQVAKRRLDPHSREYAELYLDFVRFFPVEHFGLLLLLGSGLGMLAIYGFSALSWAWLKWKLVLVVCVIVPIEIGDIWFGHFRLPRWFRSSQRDSDLQHSGNELERYENRFVPLTLPILLITVVGIIWLAVARPM
jgi:hypothetical protein